MEAPPKHLSDLAIGATDYLRSTDVKVDSDTGATYVQKDAKLYGSKLPDFAVKVTREENGCRIVIQSKSITFRPRPISDYSDLIPVTAVREELEPSITDQLDRMMKRSKNRDDASDAAPRI
jgi:hypothetical protein